MPNLPTPIRAALGLAATAVDEARKLPETVPHVVSSVPILAVSTAMQASLRLQQHLATLTARGDEVLSQLRGSSSEPPSWATFDESPEDAAGDPQAGKAAFDRIDYDHTGFAEGSDDDEGKGRWDAVGVGGTQAEAELAPTGPSADDRADIADVTATPPAPDLAEALSLPGLPPVQASPVKSATAKAAPAKAGPARSGPGKATAGKAAPATSAKSAAAKASPAKASPGKAALTKSVPTKSAPAKSAPAKSPAVKSAAVKTAPGKAAPGKVAPGKVAPGKAVPAKAAKRGGRKQPDHEPLEVAASKAKPSATPNPATMAAEILQAHEAASDDE